MRLPSFFKIEYRGKYCILQTFLTCNNQDPLNTCNNVKFELIRMVIKTRITEMYGIEKPIIRGGLMYLGVPKLAAAVSNAGGLGV